MGTILGSLFAILVVVAAFLFGLFVLLAAAVLGLLGWAAFAVRRWWLQRNGEYRGPASAKSAARSPAEKSEVIEAEYTVISRRRE